MVFLLLALACSPATIPEEEGDPLPSCGNGLVEPDEQCDDVTNTRERYEYAPDDAHADRE